MAFSFPQVELEPNPQGPNSPRQALDFRNDRSTPFKTLARDCLDYATLLYQDSIYFNRCREAAQAPGAQLDAAPATPIRNVWNPFAGNWNPFAGSWIPLPRNWDSFLRNWDPFVFTARLRNPRAVHLRVLRKFTHVSYYVDHNGIPMMAGIYKYRSTDNPDPSPGNWAPVLVIGFRGTNTPEDLVDTDFSITLQDADIPLPDTPAARLPGAAVPRAHRGFVTYLRENVYLLNCLESVLNHAPIDGPNPVPNCRELPVLFTGHSLGGAVAMLAAFNTGRDWGINANRDRRPAPVGCITFGCPRVGNPEFCAEMDGNARISLLIRLWASSDPVVKLPLMSQPPDNTSFSETNPAHHIHLGRTDTAPNVAYWDCLPDHFPHFYESLLENNDEHLQSSPFVGVYRDRGTLRPIARLWPLVYLFEALRHGTLFSMVDLGRKWPKFIELRNP